MAKKGASKPPQAVQEPKPKSPPRSRGYLEPMLKDDPREPGVLNRIKLMIEREALHEAWGCQLWLLQRTGKITPDERRAGDIYLKAHMKFRAIQGLDIDEMKPADRDSLLEFRIKWLELRGLINKYVYSKCIKSCVDALVVDDNYLTPKELKAARVGLAIMIDFFGLKKKWRSGKMV